MDTVIGNKYNDEFSILDIEVSKKLEGEYEVDEIISTFGNFFFNKMFLDITAIKDYKDLQNLQKLSMSLNMDKVILLLDKEDQISDSKEFQSRLVSMGIYNFTKDKNNLMYLYNNPNTYRDVAYLHDIDKEEEKSSTTDDNSQLPASKRILGIKNITDSAGSTTLTYLFKKILSDYYSTLALEINKRDFVYFNDKDLISIKEDQIEDTINKYNTIDTFIIDLGNSKKDYLCTDVLYLIEPSTIKLNKLVLINPKVFKELEGKKVILNKSLLNNNDIANFEVEADLKVFYNMPPLNDKEDVSDKILPLLEKLGYVKEVVKEESSNKRSIFDILRKNK
ncbi:MAG: hypothetical protein IJZ46_04225 [Bacilli bacterium]|nr:hypothetical protein [Bacilli bacterium]